MSSIIEYERSQLDKLLTIGLPTIFRKIGWFIFASCFIGLFVNAFLIDNTILKFITKYGMLIGLLAVSLAKEDTDDEMLQSLRLKSYKLAFLSAVILAFFQPVANYIVDTAIGSDPIVFKENGDWTILWLLLSIQVFYYNFLKRTQ